MVIDESDIMRMDLARHRARITIIPQEYALFRGTLRHNLDPEGRYPDTHLVDAFRHSGTMDFLEQGGSGDRQTTQSSAARVSQGVSSPRGSGLG